MKKPQKNTGSPKTAKPKQAAEKNVADASKAIKKDKKPAKKLINPKNVAAITKPAAAPSNGAAKNQKVKKEAGAPAKPTPLTPEQQVEKKDKRKAKQEAQKLKKQQQNGASPKKGDKTDKAAEKSPTKAKKPKPAKVPREPRVHDPNIHQRTIFVGNLPVNTKRIQLVRLLAEYGTVDEIRLRTASGNTLFKHKQRKNAGSLNAYIILKTPDVAKAALALNGSEFKGQHLRVTPSNSKMRTEDDSKQTIFVGNLKYTANEEKLREIFSTCGDIEYVRCIRDNTDKGCKGIGYVCFKSPESVGLALELNETMLDERPIHVERYSKQKLGAKESRDAAAAKAAKGGVGKKSKQQGKGQKTGGGKAADKDEDDDMTGKKKTKFTGVKVNAIGKKKDKQNKKKKPSNEMVKLAKKIAPKSKD